MVPPFNHFTSQQILRTLTLGHGWDIAVVAMVGSLVFFVLGAAVSGTVSSRSIKAGNL